MKQFYVYILANRKNGAIYTGITSDLIKRTWEHKNAEVDGFTRKYDVKRLVHYEIFDSFEPAEKREKTLKRWRRQWKINLIETRNPDWHDLFKEIAG
jgi:putative endonuclease